VLSQFDDKPKWNENHPQVDVILANAHERFVKSVPASFSSKAFDCADA
jgi:hypothetical protein